MRAFVASRETTLSMGTIELWSYIAACVGGCTLRGIFEIVLVEVW